ncbi:MFS general substrate transporter [Eremomyces bilateralis CBS 781.70]|uniref:MFS general substrate transporter n=1 Tax=Eremomyces bilateralis CBS 781.70 TaxID=1392243 RepID=A0A6G1FS03_9PEZI|nr:MFS general substrate transporter [Eremomyces bilateralis CBS 781.70]KAF1808452.1 MFS general substrate transporter [Eremomyces bilateralis CBS 781.70]
MSSTNANRGSLTPVDDKVTTTVSTSNDDAEYATNSAPTSVLPKSRFARWYRSTLFNVIIVGLISFTQPGIWNALYSVGAGGQQEPYVVNGASALTFGLMVFGCSIFGALTNKIGLKPILIMGTLGYAPYSAALYCNTKYGTQWAIFLGATTCGIAASALWAAEGAIAVGYPTVKERGLYTGIWLGLRQFGQLIGAAIQLSINRNESSKGAVNISTYVALIAIQCVGLPLALLISPPNKAIRSDGTLVLASIQKSNVRLEFKRLWHLLKQPQIYFLIPVLVTFMWNSSYQGIYLTKYFSVRARTLSSLTSAIGMIIGDLLWGKWLDLSLFGRRNTAKFTWMLFSVIMVGLFGWQISNEYLYERASLAATFDWNSPGFGRAYTVNLLFSLMNESHNIFVYWLLGTFEMDFENITLAVGLMRTFESLGSTLSFAVGSARITPMTNLIISFVVFAISIPTTMRVTWLVPGSPSDKGPTKANI